MFPQIDSTRLAREICERHRAREVRDENPEKRMHLRGFPPHDYAQRIARESPCLTKAVVEVADIVLLHEVGVVSENGDRRRGGLHLRRVIELHFTSRGLRRLLPRDKCLEGRVDLRRSDALLPLGVDIENHAQQLGDTLSRKRRKKNERNELEERSFRFTFPLEFASVVRLRFREVHLLYDDVQHSSRL